MKQDSSQLLHIKEDVKETVPMYKTHLNFTNRQLNSVRTIRENVYTKESGKVYSSAIQNQSPQENSDDLERVFSRTEFT